jgi:hypothetical protein
MSRDGAVRVRRVVCAVDCGTVVNPDTVHAQIQSAVIFDITAALYGQITLKDGRVEQSNFDSYQMLRMNTGHRGLHYPEFGASGRNGRGWNFGHRSNGDRRNRQALAKASDRPQRLEAAGVNGIPTLRPENRRGGLNCLEAAGRARG